MKLYIDATFLRRNSNSTLLVLKNVAKTSINAISSSLLKTRKSKTRKNIPRPKYNSAYAKLYTISHYTFDGKLLYTNAGALSLRKSHQVLFHGHVVRAIFPKPSVGHKDMRIREDRRIIMYDGG